MITSQSFLRDLKQTPKDKPSFWETDKETKLSPFKITEGAVGWRSRAYKLLNSFVRKKQSQRNNPFLFPAGNMPQQLFMIRYLMT